MKLRLLLMLILISASAAVAIIVSAQPQDEDVRGAFLDSRPKTTNLNGPSRRHRRKPVNANTSASSSSSSNSSVKTMNANAPANRNNARRSQTAIGLGYTMFMREPPGRSIRVEPTRAFHNGDRIRLALEPNVDGYIYIFDSEDGGPPKMIYPDARLDGGDNWIEAHVPVEIPSSEESEERLRWFEFYGNPGGDRIYVVLSREPLQSIPTADGLVAFCGLNKDKCPWQPPADVWQRIERATTAQVKVATAQNFGQAQTERERVAMTRGLGIDK